MSLERDLGEIKARLDAVHSTVAQIDVKLDAALTQQATHNEQIKVIQKTGGGAIGVFLLVLGGWLKQKLGL